jgi:predicted permease
MSERRTLRMAVSELARDIRFASRTLLRDRAFTTTALLTLAVCIGANAAIFSVVRSVILKPLPIPEPERVVLMANIYPYAGSATIDPGVVGAAVTDYSDRLRETTVFEAQALYRRENLTLGLPDGASRVAVIRATPSFYALLRVTPARGRLFSNDEGEPGNDAKAVLSYGFWQREFGGSDSVVGRDIRLDGAAFTVVGVMSAGFQYLWNDIDVWVPAAFTPAQRSDAARHSNNWIMIARLAPGATVAQARREVDAINARNLERFPQYASLVGDAGFSTVTLPLHDVVVRGVRPTLFFLWAGVTLVLIVGAVNLANLFMVRAVGRTREMAIRHALGAPLVRLGRQILTETTLAVAGGVLGVVAGWWLVQAPTAAGLDVLPRAHEIGLDPVSVLVMIALACVVGVLGALTPIAQLQRAGLSDAIREGGRGGSSGAAPNRLRTALATAQVALAFMLVVGGGLLVASFRAVLGVAPGFESTGVATASVTLPAARYADNAALAAGTERLLARVRALAGVTAAGAVTSIPFGETFNSSVVIPEGYVPTAGESLLAPLQVVASDGYFEAMRIPLVRGRYFEPSDDRTRAPVAIVDERLAERFWPEQDPIGRRMYLTQSSPNPTAVSENTQFITVVGVVREVPLTGLAPRNPMVARTTSRRRSSRRVRSCSPCGLTAIRHPWSRPCAPPWRRWTGSWRCSARSLWRSGSTGRWCQGGCRCCSA